MESRRVRDRDASVPAIRRRSPVVCVAESRQWCEPGIRVLIASLAAHNPDVPVELFFPVASDAFVKWLGAYPNVRLNAHMLQGPWRSWNIKPEAMLALLAGGHDDVLWVDTDVIVTSDLSRIYDDQPMEAIVVAEEAMCQSHYDGDAMRARGWGLEIGRSLPFQLNGGVVGFTNRHVDFIRRWETVLNSDEYLKAQKLPWDQRPRHFIADQEVLTALLCSTEYSHFPLRFLRRGREVIQYFGPSGYTVLERWINLRQGMPIFIHSQGHKAWLPLPDARGLRGALRRLYQDLSPYRVTARAYRDQLDDAAWLEPSTTAGRLLTGVAGGRAPLVGLPIALVNDAIRYVKWPHTGGEPRR